MKRVILITDPNSYIIENDVGIVSINDHSASKIYAYAKLTYNGWQTFHSAMFKSLIDHAPATTPQSISIVTFYFVNSLGATESGQYPGESTTIYQSEVNLISDMIKIGRTVFEFEDDKEYRQWAGNIENELKIINNIEQKGW